MEQNYEHLVGKRVRVNDEYDGVVAHIDPNVGLTIVSANDPEDRLVCITHPDIWKARHKQRANMPVDVYTAVFKAAVFFINTGDYNTDAVIQMAHKETGIAHPMRARRHRTVPASACAFT